jgi:hypothetical protein
MRFTVNIFIFYISCISTTESLHFSAAVYTLGSQDLGCRPRHTLPYGGRTCLLGTTVSGIGGGASSGHCRTLIGSLWKHFVVNLDHKTVSSAFGVRHDTYSYPSIWQTIEP